MTSQSVQGQEFGSAYGVLCLGTHGAVISVSPAARLSGTWAVFQMPAAVGGIQFLAVVRLRYHFRPVKRPLTDPRGLCVLLLGTWPSRDT